MKNYSGLLAVIFVIATLGCGQGPHVQWQCDFHESDGYAVLDTDYATFVFEGVPITLPPGQEGGGSTGSMQVSGGGKTTITLTALDQTLTNSYVKGVNTISLGKYTVMITDHGKQAQIGGKTFPLSDKKQTIVVMADGSGDIRRP
jgi:hypothetical protein